MVDDGVLSQSFACALEPGALCMVHAGNGEAVFYLQQRLLAMGITGPEGHALLRPPAMEGEAAERVMAIARVPGAPVYIAHARSSWRAVHYRQATGVT